MATINDYPVRLVNGGIYEVGIPAGENYSTPLSLGGASLVGISIPSAVYVGSGGFVQLGFYSSIDGKNDPYELLVDGSNNVTNGIGLYFPEGGAVKIPLSPALFVGVGNIQLYMYQLQSFDAKFKLILAPILQ
jgi:hypothetical protein